MDTAGYDRYKSLKSKLDYSYKGYNLKNLVPGYFDFVFDGATPPVRDIFKQFYNGTKIPDFRIVAETKAPAIITFLINRTDYSDLANAAKSYYPGSEVISLSELPTVKRPFLSFTYIRHFFKAFFLILSRAKGYNFNTKLYLTALATRLFNQISLIEKSDYTGAIKQYICFNSAFKDESLLTEFFNKRNVETITLQHGIFCDFRLFIPFDYINYDNLIARKVLCWGQSTIDYLKSNGFSDDRLIMMGNPKYKDIQIKVPERPLTRCLVLLGRNIYNETNGKLLRLLREYNRKHNNALLFYLKKHPFLLDSDHREYASVNDNLIFLGKEHSVQEVLKSGLVNFSISVNTTAYYESLALGKPSLRWAECENEEFYGMDDKFYNLSDLEKKLADLQQIPDEELEKQMKQVIKYVFNPDL